MDMTEARVTYAQNREDIIIASFFPEGYKGFYVDVGAGHPTVGSVTKYLYERGWRGINIEPNPVLHELFLKERKKDTNLNVGVADKPGTLILRVYEQFGLSTFSENLKHEYAEGKSIAGNHKDIKVPVKTLADIFKELAIKEIDILKVDVEGFEYEVIVGNDWKQYRPKLICIEANHVVKDWRPLLKRVNYSLIFSDGLNEYYVADEHKKMLVHEFSFPDKVLLGKPIIDAGWFNEIRSLEDANQNLKDSLEVIRSEKQRFESDAKLSRNMLREKDDEIVYLQAYILERGRLKSLLKELVTKIDAIVTLRLTKHTRNKKRYPAIGELAQEDAAAILAQIQQADKAAFEARPTLPDRLEAAAYKTVHYGYRKGKRGAFKSLKYVVRKARRR